MRHALQAAALAITGPRWRPQTVRRCLLAAGWAAMAAFTVWGAAFVPFHPDESTHIYLSHDFDLLVLKAGPEAVTWVSPGSPTDVLRFRLLEAPLSRYLIGLSRWLAGQPPLAVDWNWLTGWDENVRAGALPSPDLLLAARLPSVLLTALSPALVYGLGQRMGGTGVGVLAAVLYGLNGLTLLHGRRALSEAPLLFFMLVCMWLLVFAPRRWFASTLAAGLALAAKLTAVALLPALAVAWLWNRGAWPSLLVRLILVLWALSPALWAAPAAGLQAMVEERRAFMGDQQAKFQQAAPHLLLTTPGQRSAALVYHVFFAPLAFWDVANYAQQTAQSAERYQAAQLHGGLHSPSLGANMLTGIPLLGLSLAGLAHGGMAWLRLRAGPGRSVRAAAQARVLVLMAVWMVGAAAVVWHVNVPFQRYALPLLPSVCLWAAYGVWALTRPVRAATQRTLL